MNHVLTGARSAEIREKVRFVAINVNGGMNLPAALSLFEIYISEILADRTSYWYLFDNLNRDDAQLLWVWDFNRRRSEVPAYQPEFSRGDDGVFSS